MAKVYQLVDGEQGDVFDTFSTLAAAKAEAQVRDDEHSVDAGEDLTILSWEDHLESPEACFAKGGYYVWWIRVYKVRS